MEPFHFTPFGRKRLQTAPEAAGEALPNGALVSVITFRIDGHTIKRGALIGQLDHLVSLGVEILALHFRPSAQ